MTYPGGRTSPAWGEIARGREFHRGIREVIAPMIDDSPREGLLGDPMVAGRINRRVFDQDKYWWDAKGKMHVVDLMDRRYLLNVLLFCHEQHREKFDPHISPLIQKIRKRILDA